MLPPATVAETLRAATRELEASDSARLDAELLLAYTLQTSRSGLYAHPEQRVAAAANATFRSLLRERADGVPLAYLTGETEFWSLRLSITREVLVPRPETECLVEAALARASRACRIIDLGTGSGAIAAALARELPAAQLVASDRSLAATRLARRNFDSLGLEQIGVVAGCWLAPCAAATFDMVVSNPPYIGAHESAQLDRELACEPRAALFAEHAGLADLEHIIGAAPRALRARGWLLVEHGYQQAAAVRRLFVAHGYAEIETRYDLAGHERLTCGRRL